MYYMQNGVFGNILYYRDTIFTRNALGLVPNRSNNMKFFFYLRITPRVTTQPNVTPSKTVNQWCKYGSNALKGKQRTQIFPIQKRLSY